MIENNGREIRYDILMREDAKGGGLFYFCECKYRADDASAAEVKSKLKEFLAKALDSLDYLTHKYEDGGFCFLFVTSVPFGIREGDLRDIEKIKGLLEDPSADTEKLTLLSKSVRLMIVPHWLMSTLHERVDAL